MRQSHFTITEYGLIRPVSAAPDPAGTRPSLRVTDSLFDYLKTLAGRPEAENVLQYSYLRGQETIRLGSYVGLIELPGKAVLEVLPKIGDYGPSPSEAHPAARAVLLRLLRHLRDTPFKTLTNAHLGAANLPLWNVFVQAFLDTLTPLARQGLQSAYQTTQANQSFLRGSLQPARQLRENLFHTERLAVAYEVLTTDAAPNRILKSALLHVLPRLSAKPLQARLYQLLSLFQEIPPTSHLEADLRAVRTLNRLFDRYAPALRWAELLLTGRAFGVRTGPTTALSLLFPMQRVFEEYVAGGFRAYWPEGEVSAQEASAHLVEVHGGVPRFRLRPDILVRLPQRTLVFDTKWKRIDATNAQRQYGIESADLYQLFAYGKKYAAGDVFLIYPQSATFRQPLDVFGYDPAMRLHVLPFDLSRPLREEVEKVWKYVSG